MPLVVKVIAHTKFLGVPDDLIPNLGLMSSGQSAGRFKVETKGQDVGTDAERLVECAGRTCYDSYGNGRPSADYHEHIMDVDHGSVTEHVTLTFFLSGISRGLTHELVRHRVGVAISQRSTRYVDENESEWALHPLIYAFIADRAPMEAGIQSLDGRYDGALVRQQTAFIQKEAQKNYALLVEKLQAWLIAKGTDKFTARKQARGAARGLLGNALMTEMVWTCNLRTLKTVLKQRAGAAADAEIRLLANRLYEEALPYWPTYLGRYQKRPCPDGIGYELYLPDPKDARIAELENEIENRARDDAGSSL